MNLYVNVKTEKQAETVLSNENMSTLGLDMKDYGEDTVLHITDNLWTYNSMNYFGPYGLDVNTISYDEYMLTKEKPSVNMTKNQLAEMRHFKKNISKSFHAFYDNYINEGVNPFKDISEEDLMKAWLDDKVVKIIPEKKWFVRSKLYGAYANEYMWLIDYENEYGTPEYYEKVGIPSYAKKFDTREEAEKWTVPATEAVLLEVKDNG